MKKSKKSKMYNVFYTPQPVEREVIIKANSREQAVKKLRRLLEEDLQELVESVRAGWEIKDQ